MLVINGVCYIFGAAGGLPSSFKKNDGDLIIAADAGYKHLSEYSVFPDIAVGDFDSLGYVPNCAEIIKHPVRKDDTDTILAVKTGLERGYKRFVIYGGVGGRTDHTLANLQTLSYLSNRGAVGFLCGDGVTYTAVTNSKLRFKACSRGTVSVFSATSVCEGVYISGLSYELSGAALKFDFPVGVSNEFCGKPSEIGVKSGTLIVCWSGNLNLVDEW